MFFFIPAHWLFASCGCSFASFLVLVGIILFHLVSIRALGSVPSSSLTYTIMHDVLCYSRIVPLRLSQQQHYRRNSYQLLNS